jgi:hypothetical protein
VAFLGRVLLSAFSVLPARSGRCLFRMIGNCHYKGDSWILLRRHDRRTMIPEYGDPAPWKYVVQWAFH